MHLKFFIVHLKMGEMLSSIIFPSCSRLTQFSPLIPPPPTTPLPNQPQKPPPNTINKIKSINFLSGIFKSLSKIQKILKFLYIKHTFQNFNLTLIWILDHILELNPNCKKQSWNLHALKFGLLLFVSHGGVKLYRKC